MHANPSVPASTPVVVTKPTGGFRPITVLQVCMAWWAYRTGLLPRYLDFRVYLALHEVAERRLAASRVRKRAGRAPLVAVPARDELVKEIRALVGGNSNRLVRAALSRLESVGLVTLTSSPPVFATGPESLASAPVELIQFLNGLSRKPGMRERRLPVPRPMLRLLAVAATPSLAATVFGYLMRSVWWRGSELHVRGRCTAGFISERFGVDRRSVKRARSELRRIGWLVPADYRRSAVVGEIPNLLWSGAPQRVRSNRSQRRTDLSSPAVNVGTGMSPHTRYIQLPSGSKNQQPGSRRLAGIRGGKAGDSRPRLSDVRPADLSSVERIDALFDDAVSCGFVSRSPANRLRFFAAASRALRLGTRNPSGFFASIVRRGLWHVISQADEDRAIERLRAEGGTALSPPSAPRQFSSSPGGSMPNDGHGPASDAGIRSLVASLAVHCSMDKSPEVSRKYQRDQSSACAPAAWVPIGPRSKGPSEASGRGAIGWDAARGCGRALGGLSLNDGNGSLCEYFGEDAQEGWRAHETLAVGQIMRRMVQTGIDPDGSSGVSERIKGVCASSPPGHVR